MEPSNGELFLFRDCLEPSFTTSISNCTKAREQAPLIMHTEIPFSWIIMVFSQGDRDRSFGAYIMPKQSPTISLQRAHLPTVHHGIAHQEEIEQGKLCKTHPSTY